MITAALIGLWAWLFTDTLTHEEHIFHFLHDAIPDDVELGIGWRLYIKYLSCPVCHAGALSMLFACLTALGLALACFVTTVPFEFAYKELTNSFFVTPIIAMSVAKVMSLKF